MSLSMNHASSDEGTQLSEATRNRVTLAPMSQDDLDAVIAIEQTAYSHPWTRGNFRDSLNPLFEAQCLWLDGELLGYFLAMHGVEEMHLLNITVAPARQGPSLARSLRKVPGRRCFGSRIAG